MAILYTPLFFLRKKALPIRASAPPTTAEPPTTTGERAGAAESVTPFTKLVPARISSTVSVLRLPFSS